MKKKQIYPTKLEKIAIFTVVLPAVIFIADILVVKFLPTTYQQAVIWETFVSYFLIAPFITIFLMGVATYKIEKSKQVLSGAIFCLLISFFGLINAGKVLLSLFLQPEHKTEKLINMSNPPFIFRPVFRDWSLQFEDGQIYNLKSKSRFKTELVEGKVYTIEYVPIINRVYRITEAEKQVLT